MESDANVNQIAYDAICMVIDLDGFTVNGEFKVRELGYAAITADESGVFRFDPHIYIKELTHTDKSTAGYAAYQVYGMYMIPDHDQPTCKIVNLDKIVLMLYDKYKHPVRNVVGYKGGNIERDLLEKLDIPCFNIEELGCPKYEKIDTSKFTEISKNCEFHRHYRGKEFPHCARREAEVFREWLIQTYYNLKVSNTPVPGINWLKTQELCYEYFHVDEDVEFDDLLKLNSNRKRDVDGNARPGRRF